MKRPLFRRGKSRQGRTDPGSAAIYLVLALALATMFWGVFYQSMLSVQEAIVYGRSLTSYYAAEAGLERALSMLEGGDHRSQTIRGRAGAGVYETVVDYSGEQIKVYSRGYYKPARPDGNDSPEGAEKKTIIKYTGRLIWSHVVKESWESYP